MKRNILVTYILLSLLATSLMASSESSDMRKALGVGVSVPTFDRSGWTWNLHGDIPIFPILSFSPEVALGHWSLPSAGSEILTSDEANRQSWNQNQRLDLQYIMFSVRGYPLTRWTTRLSPYLLAGGGYSHTVYKDRFHFWGTYNTMSDWTKKAYTEKEGYHPIWMGGIGLDMPLDKTWALIYEYRWEYLPGKIGDKNIIDVDGLGRAGTTTTEVFSDYWMQYPINLSVEFRPW